MVSDRKDAFKTINYIITTDIAEHSQKSKDNDFMTDVEKAFLKDVAQIIRCARSLALGLDINKTDFACQCLVRCPSADQAQKALPAAKDLAAIAKGEVITSARKILILTRSASEEYSGKILASASG